MVVAFMAATLGSGAVRIKVHFHDAIGDQSHREDGTVRLAAVDAGAEAGAEAGWAGGPGLGAVYGGPRRSVGPRRKTVREPSGRGAGALFGAARERSGQARA